MSPHASRPGPAGAGRTGPWTRMWRRCQRGRGQRGGRRGRECRRAGGGARCGTHAAGACTAAQGGPRPRRPPPARRTTDKGGGGGHGTGTGNGFRFAEPKGNKSSILLAYPGSRYGYDRVHAAGKGAGGTREWGSVTIRIRLAAAA
jgi:hypothetical protein